MTMTSQQIVILGVNGDIGREICKLYQAAGHRVFGTYRRDFPEHDALAALDGVTLHRCDLSQPDDIKQLTNALGNLAAPWDLLFSAVGTSEPIGRFFALDFDEWERSHQINFTAQLRALHALYPLRRPGKVVDVALLAGGGTNNPFRCYSAYCVSKVGLIKMCELIDDETEDVNIFIVGPGFVQTKTHLETIRAGERAEGNLERVRQFVESGGQGTSFQDIHACIEWARTTGREVTGGRNLSVVHDPWGTTQLAAALQTDRDMFKLRRHRNQHEQRNESKHDE